MPTTQTLDEIVADAVRLSGMNSTLGRLSSGRTTTEPGGDVLEKPQSDADSTNSGIDSQRLDVLLSARPPSESDQAAAGGSDAALELIDALRMQTQATSVNTSAISENSQVVASSGSSGLASNVGKSLLGVFGGALGLSPLISLFGKLFGGGEETTYAPLPVYSPPAPVQYTGFLGGQAYSPVQSQNEALPAAAASGGNIIRSAPVTIRVEALDSQSFMDHSDDIAQAVRRALLESHTLNDVILEG